MPELSRFYGIVITMYPEAGERHSIPHLHARHAGYKATFSLVNGDVLAGSLPRAQSRLVQAWIEIHRGELQVAWVSLIAGLAAHKIEPLS